MYFKGALVAALLMVGAIQAAAQTSSPETPRVRLATVSAAGEAVAPGDILRTTRMFGHWNLNCEVLLSKRHHLCAVEQSVADAAGVPLLSWSIALGADGTPALAIRTAPDIDKAFGVHMLLGSMSKTVTFAPAECDVRACLVIIPFDQALRALVSTVPAVRFVVRRADNELVVDGPVAGMSEALTAAREDPIGLLAASQPVTATKAAITKPKSKPKPKPKPKPAAPAPVAPAPAPAE